MMFAILAKANGTKMFKAISIENGNIFIAENILRSTVWSTEAEANEALKHLKAEVSGVQWKIIAR